MVTVASAIISVETAAIIGSMDSLAYMYMRTGKVTVEGDLKIRRLLGGLKSSAFLARRDGSRWIIEGAGFGHGVGMCQTGAIGMAGTGKGYRDILGHYYQGSHIHALY